MTARERQPEAARVARFFGRAAANYDRHARFQRDIADRLVTSIDIRAAQDILDIGSGTGYCARRLQSQFPDCRITNLDLSEAMLDHARGEADQAYQSWICGDAQSLPFRNEAFDLVVSSLTLQWCKRPERFFSELHRVLKPGGRAWISTLAEYTLEELRASWAQVDAYVHVNTFLACGDIEAAMATVPFTGTSLENRREQYYYDSLAALARELKGIGANNINGGQARGLTGKAKLQKLINTFENNHIEGKGIPVTYDLVLIALEK